MAPTPPLWLGKICTSPLVTRKGLSFIPYIQLGSRVNWARRDLAQMDPQEYRRDQRDPRRP